jgi:fucose permease
MLAFYAFYQASLSPIMPFLRSEQGFNYTLTGLHFSAFAGGMVIAGLTGDRLAQLTSRRFVYWFGAAGMALGSIVLSGGNRAWITITGALIMGALGTLLLVAIQAALSDHHEHKRAIALTESNIAASIAGGCAPLLVGLFESLELSWRWGIYVAMGGLLAIFLRHHATPIPSSQTYLKGRTTKGKIPKAFWTYWLVIFLTVSFEWSIVFWGPDFLERVVGLQKSVAVTTMTLLFASMVTGRITGSRLTRSTNPARLLIFAMGITFVGFLLFWQGTLPVVNVVGLMIAGIGIANLFPLALAVALGIAHDHSNIASARLALSGGLAILITPLAIGWLADRLTIKNSFTILLFILFTAALITVLTEKLNDK